MDKDYFKMAVVTSEVTEHLSALLPYFTEGAELTFVMRNKNNPDIYLVMSEDGLDEVVATIRRAQEGKVADAGDDQTVG